MDEKKVREAIYCMKSFVDEAVCEECDNYDRCDHTVVADNARTAIEALEKQLPKKLAELKKCPFCGGEAILYKYFDFVNKHRVECTNCDMHTPVYITKEKAVEVWNRRVEE